MRSHEALQHLGRQYGASPAITLGMSNCPDRAQPVCTAQSLLMRRNACSARSMALPRAAALLTVSSYSTLGTCGSHQRDSVADKLSLL